MTDEKEENYTKTIELFEGITTEDKKSKEEIKHTSVTFGKRLNGRDYFNLDIDPQAQNPTQYDWLIRRKMITAFGTLPVPVPLNLLLGMDSIDLDDIKTASDEFVIESRGERTSEFRANNTVKLRYGFEIDGTFYDVVQFGNRLNGRDDVEADAVGNGIARLCFMIGRQIAKISTDDGASEIDGRVELSRFESLDGEDIGILKVGAEFFRQSFRISRKKVSQPVGGDSISSGA